MAVCKAAENGLPAEVPAEVPGNELVGNPAVGVGLMTTCGKQAVTVLVSAEEIASGSPKVPD